MSERSPILCLYVVGVPPPEIADKHGDYLAWFRRLVGDAPVEVEAFDGLAAPMSDRSGRYDAFVITGSAASLAAPEPWMEAAVELIRYAHAQKTPLLGVCFGHQLIGAAFGGSVVPNPSGWEISSYDIELSEAGAADPLFDGMPPRFEVNFSHRDIIDDTTLSPLNGITVLAGNERTVIQAVAAGPAIRGIQFHPELDGELTRGFIANKHEAIAQDANARGVHADAPKARMERARDCPAGEQVFNNWLQHWVVGGSVDH